MHILIVHHSIIPVFGYGGTERVVWDLGKSLLALGHKVSYLVPAGSSCDFAPVLPLSHQRPWDAQIPRDVDVVHFHFNPCSQSDKPYLVTEHGNPQPRALLDRNTVFLSKNHASRHGSETFVLNGLDWSSYGKVDFDRPRHRFHFLGKASWRVKNVSGAIDLAKRSGVELDVLGGDRFNWKRGLRLTWSRRIHFHGMVGGARKNDLLNASRGLVFPVRWHEPFGLAVIESLYFGCPVFATPYGSLPELVPDQCGVLSAQESVLAQAIREQRFDAHLCHAHAVKHFGAQRMAIDYTRLYERVISGEQLNARSPMLHSPAGMLPWC